MICREVMSERMRNEAEDDLAQSAQQSHASAIPGSGTQLLDVNNENAKYQRRRRIGRFIGMVLSVGIFLLSIFVCARVVANLNMSQLRAAIAATSAEQIAGASLLAALSYLALTGYDALALRQLREHVRYRITSLASFTSYAISFTLGFPLITGGTVRYWIYSRAGLSGGKVASLTVIAGLTFWLGMAFVVGASLLFKGDEIAALDRLSPLMNQIAGAAILAGILGYFVWVSLGRRTVRVQGFKLELPGPLLTTGQMMLGLTDLCAAAGVLFVLLPAGHGLDFPTFAAIYVFACMLGIASHAPGGIGVFEATMIKFVPSPGEEKLIAALLLFRVIYYLVPFELALALLGANEGLQRWSSLRSAMLESERQSDQNGDDTLGA